MPRRWPGAKHITWRLFDSQGLEVCLALPRRPDPLPPRPLPQLLTMTAQRELPVPEIETLCVLAHVSEARLTLRGHNEREIFALIDAGYLLAWNIALKPSKMSRELRILPESIEHYKRTGKPWPTHALSGSVVQTLLRGGLDKKPFLYSPTIALILNCKDTTVTN